MSAAASIVQEAVNRETVQASVPVNQVYVMEGFNPRRYFDDGALDKLAQSIEIDGLIQPVVLRKRPDEQGQYHLVAGERRFRAVQKLGWEAIEAKVMVLNDEQARIVAVKENQERENIGPGEEACAAREVLDACEGDREVAAKELGWSRSKLDSRLLLLKATAKVIEALNGRSITIAHAELLAGLPEDNQDATLPKIIEQKITPAQLRERIDSAVAIDLAEAVFDRTDCNGCPHNTQTQRTLFDTTLDGEKCQNRACFNDKTKAALSEKLTELAEDYPKVALASETDPGKVVPLIMEGDYGVGPEQFKTGCSACKFRGAVINDRLDGKTGRVNRSVCFDSACNSEKRVAYRKTLVNLQEQRQEAPAASHSVSAPATKPSSTSKPKASAPAISKGVIAVVREQLRDQAVAEITADIAAAITLKGLQHACAMPEPADESPEAKAYHEAGRKSISELSALGAQALASMQAQIARLAMRQKRFCESAWGEEPSSDQRKRWAELAPAATVTINEALINAMTRTTALDVLEEIGFFKWLEKREDGEKAVKEIKKAKKSDLAKLVFTHDQFDFSGHKPKFAKDALAGK
jgi:PRTRC genetic system ParB family protein